MDSKLELQNNEFLRQFETLVNGQLARIEYAEQEKKIFLTKKKFNVDQFGIYYINCPCFENAPDLN